MAITVVQTATAAPGGGPGTFVISLGSAPSNNNSVILCIGAPGDGVISTVADNQTGNVWSRGPHAVDSGNSGFHAMAECWLLPAVAYQTGTYTVTATPSIPGSGANPGSFLMEVSGLAGTIDKSGIAQDTAAGNTQLTVAASAQNTNANALVVCFFVIPSAATDFSAGPTAGYTSIAVFNGNNQGVSCTGGYKIVSSLETSQAVSPTWTTANFAAGIIATFGAVAAQTNPSLMGQLIF